MASARGRLLCLMFLVQAPVALAETATPTPAAPSRSGDPAYDSLIEKAVSEFNLGHWGEAKAFFLRAHQLHPNARTLRSLGHSSYELRLYVDAIRYFSEALRSEAQPLTPQLRAHAEQQLADARSFVTHVELVLEPAHATVHVGGREPAFDEDGTLLLDPGLHELAATAPDHEPEVRTITAHAAERIELRFILKPVPNLALEPPMLEEPIAESAPPPAAATPDPTPPPPAEASSLSTAQWVGIGLGAAGLVAGGVALSFSLAAVHENNVSKRSCKEGCDEAGRDARKSALALADVATASAITAGVLVVSGAACFFAAPRSSERQAASWRVTPVASTRSAGMIATGTF